MATTIKKVSNTLKRGWCAYHSRIYIVKIIHESYFLHLKLILITLINENKCDCKCGSRGGGGGRGSGPPPPGKSQVIWVSIGNKQLDPPPPLETVGPPENCWTPSGALKNDRFL